MLSGTHTLLFVLAALAPLGAQSLKEALAALPSDVTQIEVYRDAATLDARFAATLGAYPKPKKGLVAIYDDLELAAGGRTAGPVVRAEFKGVASQVKRVAFWVPAKDFGAFTRKLGAVPAQGAFKVKRKAGTYYLAKRGAFAVASLDRELLNTIQAAPTRLGAGLEPMLPWFAGYDLATVAPPAVTQATFAALRQELETGKNPGLAALKPYLKPLLDQAGTSVVCAAVGVAFPPDGTIRGQAKAFFKPGSPLAVLGGQLAFPRVQPMEGLSPVGFVLGLGGPLPQFQFPVPPGLDADQAAKLAAIQAERARNTKAFAFTLGVPAGPGAPILGSMRWFLKVEDPGPYLKSVPELAKAQNAVLTNLGLDTSVVMDVLPGVPSCTTTFTFDTSKAAKPTLPPAQMKMLLTLLFGSPDRILASLAQVDDHTVLGVVGDAGTLKAALAGFGPGFQQDPGVAAVDALLPAAAPWKTYFNLGNARDLARMVLESFAPGQKTLPAVPAVPPVGLALLMDTSGVELDGAVAPATLAASLAFAQAMEAPKAVQVK